WFIVERGLTSARLAIRCPWLPRHTVKRFRPPMTTTSSLMLTGEFQTAMAKTIASSFCGAGSAPLVLNFDDTLMLLAIERAAPDHRSAPPPNQIRAKFRTSMSDAEVVGCSSLLNLP